MQPVRPSAAANRRDLRIDWLRGLAMTCVIVNHSKLSSVLSWFSYERLWVVTAAEVFVALSGIVLGMVYGRRLLRDGWRAVVRGLGRRALLLYAMFVGVTVSILALAALGVDVRSVAGDRAPAWFLAPHLMTLESWRDVLLMRAGSWAFEIIGLYVWLVAAAVPCLLILHRAGWRPLIAASWALYFWYRLQPHAVTTGGFESAFPLLAWQLLFVHGITIGYERDHIARFVERMPRCATPAAVAVTAGFTLFAFCNPWTDGPAWLRVHLVSADQFASLYAGYFNLSDLRAGRLLNLAIALPVGYRVLTEYWHIARPVETLFVTLGQRSLGAFVLHVYGLLLIAHVPLADSVWVHTLVQIAFVVAIAALLNRAQGLRYRRREQVPARAEPLAA